jgi:hypothetical protein
VSTIDPSTAISERPSPVSVLDSSFDQEDLFPTSGISTSLTAGKISFLPLSKLLVLTIATGSSNMIFVSLRYSFNLLFIHSELFVALSKQHLNQKFYVYSILYTPNAYSDSTVSYCGQMMPKFIGDSASWHSKQV